MLTDQVHGARFGLGAERVKRLWKGPCVHLFCEWKSLLLCCCQPTACGSLLREEGQTICSHSQVSLFSQPAFPAAANSSVGAEGCERVGCVRLPELRADRGKGTYLFAVVKPILVAVGQVEFVNLPSAPLLSLCQFIQGSVELLLTRSLREYSKEIINIKITQKPAEQKMVRIKPAKKPKTFVSRIICTGLLCMEFLLVSAGPQPENSGVTFRPLFLFFEVFSVLRNTRI